MTETTERPIVGDLTQRDVVIVPCEMVGAPGFEPWELECDVVLPVKVAERLMPTVEEVA